MIADANGRVDAARYVASDNCDERPTGEAITLLVIHNISLPPGEFGGDGIERLFTNDLDCAVHPYYSTLAGVRVSAHFLIRRTGELLQFVPCEKRAWHAGASAWRGRSACNDFSIGVELEGTDDVPYAEPQYLALAGLARALRASYPIADIVGHCDIAPGRKTDPGPSFDWIRLRSSIGQ
ncbi:MAG: 1,6-anhydro-N-acetylmuramyl-L-alanine amidase AmpD [Burkholderiales bacterium]|nr:1,6-anhydro-N-acetylmuramyl-L-alanine amidase AmpD [Burkholderiales bacterium]